VSRWRLSLLALTGAAGAVAARAMLARGHGSVR
jgi:hypothetical protein